MEICFSADFVTLDNFHCIAALLSYIGITIVLFLGSLLRRFENI